jgi:hypothetical protein
VSKPKPKEHKANGPYYPVGDLGGEYCIKCRQPWPCRSQQYIDSGEYEGEYEK